MVNEQMQFFMRGFRRDAHPMAVMTGLVGALSAFYPDSINLHDAHERDISAIRLIAKLPTLVAMAYKYSVGQPYMYPRNDLSYAANFMRMMFATPCEDYKVNDVLVRARRPHLHPARRPRAERVDVDGAACARRRARTRSRRSPPASPACGGRRTAAPTRRALNMLGQIQARAASRRSASSSRKVKDKNSSVKLMGFGHRVYKNYDPRAKLMRETCHEVLDELGLGDDPLFKLAMALEKIALEDEYFVLAQALSERRLLFGHRAEGDRHPGAAVHRDLRAGAHGRLDRAVERDDRRSGIQDRPAAAALHRRDAALGEAGGRALGASGEVGRGLEAARNARERTTRSA